MRNAWIGRCFGYGKPKRHPDVIDLSAITELVGEVRPNQGLLSSIEEELDYLSATQKKKGIVFLLWLQKNIWIIATMVGIVIGAIGHYGLGQSKQSIIVQSAANSEWVSMGFVTLRGSLLRSYVKSKCENHTHLSILLKGKTLIISPSNQNSEVTQNQSIIMKPDEKILMECIH